MKFFPAIKSFFTASFAGKGEVGLVGSELKRFSKLRIFVRWLAIFFAGCFAATAFPPLNFPVAAFTSLACLWLSVRNYSALKAALAGWLWGMGYALCSFFWLREINPAIPWLMMVVLGAYYIPVGWTAAVANRYILLTPEVRKKGFSAQIACRDFALYRQIAWCLVCASSLVLVEYLRHTVLPWNYFGVAFYRNAVLMQSVRIAGVSGLSMLAALVNAALVLAVLTIARKDPESGALRYRRPVVLMGVLLILAVLMAYGIISLRERRREYAGFENKVRMTLVQGDLHPGRFSTEEMGYKTLARYLELTRTQKGVPTDVVVWPETAIAYPLRGTYNVSRVFRAVVRQLSAELNAPMLVGTLEFDESTDPPGSLNSAVLTDTRDILLQGYRAIYSKVHPVPFGEFVPMRRYLPQWVIKIIDMNRDLTPGKSLAPIELNGNVRFGVSICFEDVFPYIARGEVLRGANVLLVIADDAWYPTSSEPEQHLANAIARAVENNLPMVRCGNDSVTCLISPAGEVIWSLAEEVRLGNGKPYDRGAGAATITVNVPGKEQIGTTFYARTGNWVAALAAVIYLLALAAMLRNRVNFVKSISSLG
ncbi:MAG: apolipoprotein N-acyltransferase [Lentisphaerae bacterium]|nr:apolipoprotein N-acyltransferase [Lentisphaerota bacterium]